MRASVRPRARVRTSVNMRERVLECSKLPAYNLGGVCCSECKSGPIVFREEMSRRQGSAHFHISTVRVVRRCQKYHSRLWVRAGHLPSTGELYSQTKCAGGSHSGLEFLFALLDLPPPVSRNIYSHHMDAVSHEAEAEGTR